LKYSPSRFKRDCLEQFLQRAAAARQGDHRVRVGEQAMLALAHVLHQFQSGQSGMAPFQIRHEARQDADHLATFG
jgi:hypothetical protein